MLSNYSSLSCTLCIQYLQELLKSSDLLYCVGMQLAAFLNVNYEGDDLLPVMLVVFNLVPVSIFLAVMSFTIVVNFGVALLVQCSKHKFGNGGILWAVNSRCAFGNMFGSAKGCSTLCTGILDESVVARRFVL